MTVRDRRVAHRSLIFHRLAKKRCKRFRLNPRSFSPIFVLLPITIFFIPYLLLRPTPSPKPIIPHTPTHTNSQHHHQPSFAPRHARHTLISSRTLTDEPGAPAIHAFHLCRSNCCAHLPALSTLLRQTLPPTHLTLIHACPPSSAHALKQAARKILADPENPASSYQLRPELGEHACQENVEYVVCVLRYLANVVRRIDGWAFILDDAVLLEPVALEKAWLSAFSRPHVSAVRIMEYDIDSLRIANETGEPLAIKRRLPSPDAIQPIPLFLNVTSYQIAVDRALVLNDSFADWAPFIDILSDARIIRESLYSRSGHGDVLSLRRFDDDQDKIPAHLFTETAFYRWSAQRDEKEIYAGTMFNYFDNSESPAVPLSSIPHWNLANSADSSEEKRIFLVLPWMQIGGSEKCTLDIAERLLNMNWGVTFVLTMPFWNQDEVGEIALTHQWLDRALALSTDTFDLLALAPNHMTPQLFRYLLESRRPDFLLMANSRWAYYQSRFINTVSPETVVADYNHMIHKGWEGGGLPRFGANYSEFFDLHMTASRDVADHMRKWIKPQIMRSDPLKVQPCYIGVDPTALFSGVEKAKARAHMRAKLDIAETTTVVLFAGRFVVDKGIDVMSVVIKRIAKDHLLANQLTFLFVGRGEEDRWLKDVPRIRPDGKPLLIVRPPVDGLTELRHFYAAADIFLLPSINEGIALVVYEAMAAGLLVITTDVGGQRELVTEETGILLNNYRSLIRMANHTFDKLKEVVDEPEAFRNMVEYARDSVRSEYTTERFCTCVVNSLLRAYNRRLGHPRKRNKDTDKQIDSMKNSIAQSVAIERYNGQWNRNMAKRSLESYVTIGVKTYVCDMSIVTQVRVLLHSIRENYPRIRVLLGNDGPSLLADQPFVRDDPYTEEISITPDTGISYGRNLMVNHTTTPYFLLLDDDHVFDDMTNLTVLINGIRGDEFDIVGMRVRNLPGIEEYEREGIVIPRYVAEIQSLQNRDLKLCVWNENNGPSVFGIEHPLKVDVLHNAFVAKVDTLRRWPWRNELKVNEHMTFFLDAKDAGLRIGYLPSVFVHHRPRDYSDCYFKVRFREDKYRPMLRYRDQFLWDMRCQAKFPERVRQHIIKYELDF